MTTSTLTLTEFLLARIAEDEAKWGNVIDHRGEWDGMPSRVLAECEARRRIVREAWAWPDVRWGGGWAFQFALRALALPYADHPDYREEWRQ